MATKATIILILISSATGVLSIVASIATPCSANANGKLLYMLFSIAVSN